MKRTHQSQYKYLWRTWPVFAWRLCVMCKVDFRREWGWRALVGPWVGGRGQWVYLCRACAPSVQRASEIAEGSEWVRRPTGRVPIPPQRKAQA